MAEPSAPERGGASAQPAPVEATRAQERALERQRMKMQPGWRLRRALIVTAVHVGVWLLVVALVHVDGAAAAAAVLLVPLYAITLALVLRRPRPKARRQRLMDRVGWQTKLIGSILVFMLIYLPFTFISNRVIPYAPLVEYAFFAVALFVLYRLIARSIGVAPAVEALPPATHRTHRQVVGAIDDPHYQRMVVLNYNFIERGKGAKALEARLERILEQNAVPTGARDDVLEPLRQARGGAFFAFTSAGRQRRARGRQRRESALRNTLHRFNKALEVSS